MGGNTISRPKDKKIGKKILKGVLKDSKKLASILEIIEGIEKVKTIQIQPIFQKRQFVFDDKLIFVLMPFSEPWSDRIWAKLKEILESNKLKTERADNRHGPIIMEDIWCGIMEARIIICDTTGWNPNVFYELGIAHTIGKPVILLSQPTQHLPFDTRGFRHLFYTDNPDGMKKLEKELPQCIDYYLSQKVTTKKISIRKPKKK